MPKSSVCWDYSQPNFYHFSSCSIELADWASQLVIENNRPKLKVLDVFAGCGVVGLEMYERCSERIERLDFVELQDVFEFDLKENIKNFGIPSKMHIHICDYRDFLAGAIGETYHLILANPPFFSPDKFRMPKNPNKKLCKVFVKGRLEDFCHLAKSCLAPGGRLVYLHHDDASSSLKVWDERKTCDPQLKLRSLSLA